jgi:uncharacterized membrane protein
MARLFRDKYRVYDPVWHVQVVMVIAIALQLILPNKFLAGSRYVTPALELLLLLALSFTTPKERIFRSLSRRINVILLIAIAGLGNLYSLLRVVDTLLQSHVNNGRDLILSAVNIYLTNVIVFALLYWEMDGGGPGERAHIKKHEQDFLFPQNQNENYAHPDWRPTFADYLYVSFTNAMAFSPTDTLPLTRRAKVLMLIQATVSLAVIALVAARAVNILT